jgi:hypothetical protein
MGRGSSNNHRACTQVSDLKFCRVNLGQLARAIAVVIFKLWCQKLEGWEMTAMKP